MGFLTNCREDEQSCIFLTCTHTFQGVPVTLDKHTLGFDTGGEWFVFGVFLDGVSQCFPTILDRFSVSFEGDLKA